MPGSPRSALIDLSVTPFYHCVSRCVRRAFLCGDDAYSGRRFNHRKAWLVDRLRLAAEAFSIDVCAYAVMSNHFHVVLRVDVDRANKLSDSAVIERYGRFFPQSAKAAHQLPAAARRERIAVIRARLSDVSWFMRVINEYISRRANKEDEATGHFWEGRFRSQALLDDRAVLACMSYVDLNPVRAGAADRLERSAFTSIRQRLDDVRGTGEGGVPLAPMRQPGRRASTGRRALDVNLSDYIALVEWTGRQPAPNKGALRGPAPEILTQLGIDHEAWRVAMTLAGLTGTALGDTDHMAAEADRRGCNRLKGMRTARALFKQRR